MFKIVMDWSDFVALIILSTLIIIYIVMWGINSIFKKFKKIIGGKDEKQKENAKTYGSR